MNYSHCANNEQYYYNYEPLNNKYIGIGTDYANNNYRLDNNVIQGYRMYEPLSSTTPSYSYTPSTQIHQPSISATPSVTQNKNFLNHKFYISNKNNKFFNKNKTRKNRNRNKTKKNNDFIDIVKPIAKKIILNFMESKIDELFDDFENKATVFLTNLLKKVINDNNNKNKNKNNKKNNNKKNNNNNNNYNSKNYNNENTQNDETLNNEVEPYNKYSFDEPCKFDDICKSTIDSNIINNFNKLFVNSNNVRDAFNKKRDEFLHPDFEKNENNENNENNNNDILKKNESNLNNNCDLKQFIYGEILNNMSENIKDSKIEESIDKMTLMFSANSLFNSESSDSETTSISDINDNETELNKLD